MRGAIHRVEDIETGRQSTRVFLHSLTGNHAAASEVGWNGRY
jgi:hypothetical protein